MRFITEAKSPRTAAPYHRAGRDAPPRNATPATQQDKIPLAKRYPGRPFAGHQVMFCALPCLDDMAMYQGAYRIESTRLREWDYAAPGWYFVTICTKDRLCFFGGVEDGMIARSEVGEVALSCWEDIPSHFPHVVLDAFIVMPNHVRGLIGIPFREQELHDQGNGNETSGRDAACCVSTGACVHDSSQQYRGTSRSGMPDALKGGSLPVVIRSYKAAVTRAARLSGNDRFAWQPRYHERIIRGDRGLNAVREYIRLNPARWVEDRYHSAG